MSGNSIGDTVLASYSGLTVKAVIRFIGSVSFDYGEWIGIELVNPIGKSNGSVKGVVYFTCPARHGAFVRSSAIKCRDYSESVGNLKIEEKKNQDYCEMESKSSASNSKIVSNKSIPFNQKIQSIKEISNSVNELRISPSKNSSSLSNSAQKSVASIPASKSIGSCFPVGIKGMSNLGNTCYLNSVLQVLLQIPELRQFYLDPANEASSLGIFNKVCRDIMYNVWNVGGPTLTPSSMVNAVSDFPGYKGRKQQDAAEFMRLLFNQLHDEVVLRKENKNESIIKSIFEGVFDSIVTCSNCSNISSRKDSFFDISIHVPSQQNSKQLSGSLSVSSCWDNFVAPEELNGYRCEKCSTKCTAHRKLLIGSPPNYLILNLLRQKSSQIAARKNIQDVFVSFEETLDINPYCSSFENSVPLYTLVGIVIHSGGGANAGHYTAYVKSCNFSDEVAFNDWYYISDNKPRKTDIKEVLSRTPYLLFYRKL